LVGSRT
jgi:hypothetical protein